MKTTLTDIAIRFSSRKNLRISNFCWAAAFVVLSISCQVSYAVVVISDGFGDGDRNNNGLAFETNDAMNNFIEGDIDHRTTRQLADWALHWSFRKAPSADWGEHARP